MSEGFRDGYNKALCDRHEHDKKELREEIEKRKVLIEYDENNAVPLKDIIDESDATKAENERLKEERDDYKEGGSAEAEIVNEFIKENDSLKSLLKQAEKVIEELKHNELTLQVCSTDDWELGIHNAEKLLLKIKQHCEGGEGEK